MKIMLELLMLRLHQSISLMIAQHPMGAWIVHFQPSEVRLMMSNLETAFISGKGDIRSYSINLSFKQVMGVVLKG